jgi:hypothetical protein
VQFWAIHTAAAQMTANSSVTMSATVNAWAKLAIGSTTVTFANTDPDTTPIPATEGAIAIGVKARTSAAGPVTLTILAATNLTSGTNNIAISNITWAAGGAGFVAGTMATGVGNAQPVASFSGSIDTTGSQTYSMVNSWIYPTGVYSATATYTLTAP